MKNNICIGIVSYLPDNINDRNLRIDRLKRLFKQLNKYFKNIPILIIAQNWKDFKINNSNIYQFNYDKLGILQARKTLRKHFLSTNYKGIVLFDDDAIIECEKHSINTYLNLIDNNIDGFSFVPKKDNILINPYNDSQLNLCYISRYIFEKEDFPNIDAEKSEGFEDRIFSTLLHYKYSYKEFKFPENLMCIHFKNKNEKAPSTWAQEKLYNWSYMRENTYKIEKYIKEYKELPENLINFVNDKIDLVVPYVDSNDINWIKLFNKYNNSNVNNDSNNIVRFRGQGNNFKYFFRSIERNLPFINNIYLIVQSKSQIPNWLDCSKVKIVLHEDFIPKEYLPTFNSCTIEMFLWNIKDLSDKFIYLNDDIYVTQPIKVEDLFENDKLKFNITASYEINQPYLNHCYNASKLVLNNITKNKFYKLNHSIRPYLKGEMKKCYLNHEKEILNSISQFRECKNINIYVYSFYLASINKYIKSQLKTGYITSESINDDYLINNVIKNDQVVCFNDCDENVDIYQKLSFYFNNLYPNKSKYELNDEQIKIQNKEETKNLKTFTFNKDINNWINSCMS